MSATTIHPAADAIGAKGLQSRSLRGQKTIIDAKLHEDLKGTLIVLLRHYNDQSGLCCPGQDLIAAKLGVSENTVRARLRQIEKRGLVTIHRTGRWNYYTVHFDAIDALEPAVAPVDNSLDTLNLRARHPQNTASTPSTHDADTLKPCALTGKGTGLSTEEGTESHAGTDQDEAACPPLPDFEGPKTEQPKPEQPELAIDDVLARISEMPAQQLPYIAQSVTQLIEAQEAGKAQQRRLVAQVASAFGAPQVPVAPATTAQPSSPAPTAPATATLAIDPAQLETFNARRIASGKDALTDRDLCDLATEARLAGRTLANLVELINARGWLFARADWKGVKVDAAPARTIPSEPTPQARAAAEAHAARLRAIDGTGTPASAATVAACIARLRGTAPKPATMSSTLAMGSTGTGWARAAVDRFVGGQTVAHAAISAAAAALKLSLVDLKAQRAANLAAVAA